MTETFKCSKCDLTFAWLLKGGSNKMIGDPVHYADKRVTECVYCVGHYPDGTPITVKKLKSKEKQSG